MLLTIMMEVFYLNCSREEKSQFLGGEKEMSRADDFLEYGTEEYWAERIAEDAEEIEAEMEFCELFDD